MTFMRTILFFVFVLFNFGIVDAQQKPVQLGPTASDCIGALMINDTVVGPVYSPAGYGKKIEIYGYQLGDPFFIQQEHNTVWYKFIAPYDAVFTFDLLPEVKEDDFDFMLFAYDGPNFCKDIAEGRKIPVRTNISRKNIFVDGRTGLSESAIDEYVPSGPGSSYSRALKVKQGEMLYLLVDNPFRENKGHSIYLHWRRTSSSSTIIESENDGERRFVSPIRKLQINVVDKDTEARIPSNISVDGLPDSLKSSFVAVSEVQLEVVSYRTYEINVVKKGYLLAYESFIPKNDSAYALTIPIKEMKKGDRINLANIKFDSDKTEILDKSKGSLDQLGAFMEINPGIHIEIQGHVNGEGKRNKRRFRKLSEARAKAIYEKLLERGIDKSRLSFAGFGNAKMIYPSPVNNRQAEANRRVEAEVTKL
jgi:outer membrane protein OmpA-like peptidoglycan-associated protein